MHRFTGLPFLAGVKEAKFRGLRAARRRARDRGAGWCTTAPATPWRQARSPPRASRSARREITYRVVPFPNADIARDHDGDGRDASASSRPSDSHDETERTRRETCGSPASAWSPASAKGLEAHWDALDAPASPPAVDDKSFAPYTVHPLAPLELRQADPEEGRPAADGAVAAHRHLCRRAGARRRRRAKATPSCSTAWT